MTKQTEELIAELLHVCKMIKQWYDYEGDGTQMLEDCISAAVIAIKKAEGEIDSD